jgi:hypothetical protein
MSRINNPNATDDSRKTNLTMKDSAEKLVAGLVALGILKLTG